MSFFSSDPQFVRGSDGRIYEIHDNDREGGIMFFFIAIFMAISYAIYAAYIWMIKHYLIMLGFTFVGIMTWTGWAYHDYQQKRTYDDVGKKIWAFLLVLAGFYLSTAGFSQAIKGAKLKHDIQGEWIQPESHISLKITSDKFILKSPEENIIIEGACTAEYDLAGFVWISVNGTEYVGTKVTANGTPYQQNYQCRIIRGELTLGGNQFFQRR